VIMGFCAQQQASAVVRGVRNLTDFEPTEIDKITVEIINLEFPVLSNIWSMLGGKYLPSIVYKFRMLNFNQYAMNEEIIPLLFTPK